MFLDLPVDKIRSGLKDLKRLLNEEGPLFSDPVKVTGLIVDDEMVGVVVYNKLRIFALCVPTAHQGCGYGKQLLTYVLNTEKICDIVTYISPSNTHAVSVFVRWGFVFEGTHRHIDHPGYKNYRMVLRSLNRDEVERPDITATYKDCSKLSTELVVAFNPDINI